LAAGLAVDPVACLAFWPAAARPAHTLPDALPLELRNRSQDVHLQLAGWRRRVDALRQADERNPQRLQLVEQRNQVLQIASQSIEPPADQHVEPPAPGIADQIIQRRRSFAPEIPTIDAQNRIY